MDSAIPSAVRVSSRINTPELSHDDLESLLRSAVATKKDEYVSIPDVFSNSFVYERNEKLYRQKYKATKGQVLLIGGPQHVIKVTQYVLASKVKLAKVLSERKKARR